MYIRDVDKDHVDGDGLEKEYESKFSISILLACTPCLLTPRTTTSMLVEVWSMPEVVWLVDV